MKTSINMDCWEQYEIFFISATMQRKTILGFP